MKPLPDLPDRDEPGNQTANNAVWFLVFLGLGLGILSNRSPQMQGWAIVVAVISFAAATVFLFQLLLPRKRP